MRETKEELKARLHQAIFGDTLGYDLEYANVVHPVDLATARRLGLLTALRRLRRS